jgi:3-hydroxyisobutyrate dehydrogenase-like beta-hydroxyacid dehydrogenase
MAEHKLGQVGLGVLGRLFVGHLLKTNNELIVFDINPEAVKLAAELGASPAASAQSLAAQCDRIILSLPSPTAVEAAMLGEAGILEGAHEGTAVLDLSTIDPFTAKEIYAAAKAKGVSYLDSPVSGGAPGGAGTDGARAATISFMVGGDEAAFAAMKPYMEVLGKRFFYMGPAGSGSTVKRISNLVAGLHNLVDAEAFVLAAAAGISPQTLLDVFDGTDAKSFWLEHYFAPRIKRQDFEPGFAVDLQYKDHRLAEELAQQLKVPLLFNQLAVQFYQMMRAQGLGAKDLVEAVNFLGKLADVDIYNPREPQA